MSEVKKPNNRLVYVDDQKDNLIVFEAHVSDSWEIRCYANAADALKELKQFDPAIILSDMKMGRMTGVEFLRQGKEILPRAVRMIITGYSSENLIIDSIRYAQVFDYIIKPYDHTDVDNRLQKARAQYEENLLQTFEKSQFEKTIEKLSTENRMLKDLVHTKDRNIEALKIKLNDFEKRITEIQKLMKNAA